MTRALLLVCATASCLAAQSAPAPSAADLARAKRILAMTPIVDGHNDVPWEIRESPDHPRDVEAYDLRTPRKGKDTDLARMKAGMMGGQFWSVYIPGEIKDSGFARVQAEQIDIARRMIARYPERLTFARTAAEGRRATAAGKVASFLGMEGGHAIENSLGTLRAFYDLGARYMTLTHNVTLDWADAAQDSAKHGGLTPFGREVVREMNRLGMLVDLSHVSPGVMSHALDVSEAPIIFSHSSARAIADHKRNVPDSILRRLPKNGGVVMVTYVPGFVSEAVRTHGITRGAAHRELRARLGNDSAAVRRELAAWDAAHPAPVATLRDVADHLDHIKKVAGADHVGIGGDFDGTGGEHPVGLEDVSTYPALIAELARRGWTDAELRKVAGENIMRVLTQAEQVAARLQRTRAPSTKTIEELDRRRM
ncbi:MAG: dipeptidase [Gemmatimonadaceae bacterium]|nr:dipeptidase [Gemmatimonadaceae bacterium]